MELTGPHATIKWAFSQLKRLDDECLRINESEPFYIADDFDPDSRCHVMRFRVREEVFPPYLGPLVGSVIHAARSALDQAMWSVACRSNDVDWLWKPHVAKDISFPPVWSRKRLPGHSVMPFITDDAKAVLQKLQTHEGGDPAQALRDLDQFWNIDKHRVSHNGVARLDLSEIRFRPGSVYTEDLVPILPETEWLPLSNPVKDGAEIAKISFRSGLGPPHTQVKVEGEPSALVAFGGGPVALSTAQIAMLVVHAQSALLMLQTLPDEAPRSEASTEKGYA